MNFKEIDQIITRSIPSTSPAAQLAIYWHGELVHHQAYGHLDPGTQKRLTQLDTHFDIASLTKLFVTTAFMTLVESGEIGLDEPVSSVLPDFSGKRPIQPYEDPLNWGEWVTIEDADKKVDASRITFRQLLTHRSGLPAWRPLFGQESREAALQMTVETFFSYTPNERVIYSDIGLILLGLAIEKMTDLPLDEALAQRVCLPLGLVNTRYNPASENIAPTEFCAWRKRRIVGEVHDENADRLDGVSGHAGLFSTANGVAAFGQSFLDASLLKSETIAEMTTLQAEDKDIRRGLGFLLHSADPANISYAFGARSFGHTGFTGTSLWVDPDHQLVIALLTNRVYHGRDGAGILRLRRSVHKEVIETINRN
ncbi:MAG: beta-lactamase family protein [Chloroflexi bacterium]|nr:beta-lactamase family protein [Chloroflexota bacterium]